jgi:hypothetical protein
VQQWEWCGKALPVLVRCSVRSTRHALRGSFFFFFFNSNFLWCMLVPTLIGCIFSVFGLSRRQYLPYSFSTPNITINTAISNLPLPSLGFPFLRIARRSLVVIHYITIYHQIGTSLCHLITHWQKPRISQTSRFVQPHAFRLGHQSRQNQPELSSAHPWSCVSASPLIDHRRWPLRKSLHVCLLRISNIADRGEEYRPS